MNDSINTDSTLVAQLSPVYTPESVLFSPQTIGWFILAVVVVAILIFVIALALNKYRARRYRRLAISLLESLEPSQTDKVIVEACEILKRVAIKSYDRDVVAGLAGQEWVTFLETRHKAFDNVTRDILIFSQYHKQEKRADMKGDKITIFLTDIKTWIKHHHV